MIEREILKQESLPPYSVGTKSQLEPSEEKLRLLGDFLLMRFQKLKRLREDSGWEKEKAQAFKDYHMEKRDRALPYPGAANLTCPLPRIGVDAFHSNVMFSLFSNGTEMKVKPVVINKDFADTARKAAKYMSYVINQEADTYMAFDDSDKKAQMFGNGYLEPCYIKEEIWETVESTVTKPNIISDPMTGQVTIQEIRETVKEKKKKTVFDGVKIYSIPVESIYKSPFYPTLKQAAREDVVIKVFKVSFSDVKDRTKKNGDMKPYYIKSQVDKIAPLVTEKMTATLGELEQARAKMDGFYLDMLSRDQDVELAEAHLWWDIDGDDIKEEITATFHPATGDVIRVTLSPCRIVEFIPRPIDGRGYGEGIPRICTPLTEEWENFHNTRSNAGQWENTTFGFYRAGGRLNPQQITIQPGRFYPVDDPREVQFAQVPRTGTSYFQEESLILNYFERIFALDENMQGVSAKGAQTATETLRVSTKASVRFANPFNRTIAATNELLGYIWDLNMECAPENKEFYVVGEGGEMAFDRMSKNDFSKKFKFSVEVSSVFDQQMVRDTMLLAYRMFLVNPLVQQHPETLWDLSQKTLTSIGVDLALNKPEQAKTLSPFEEHEMIQRGEPIEPQLGEDYDHHLKIHDAMLKGDEIAEWEESAIQSLILHRDQTKILKTTLESANLNKSGMFTGNPMANQGSMTVNRSPTQKFNTVKVGESGNSMKQNMQNGSNQNNAEQSLNATLGPV